MKIRHWTIFLSVATLLFVPLNVDAARIPTVSIKIFFQLNNKAERLLKENSIGTS